MPEVTSETLLQELKLLSFRFEKLELEVSETLALFQLTNVDLDQGRAGIEAQKQRLGFAKQAGFA